MNNDLGMAKVRYLTKSRFKLGLECPAKLFYTGKGSIYANQKNEDPFLRALAQGGFQVEELARMEYPGGILIDGEHGDYEGALKRTEELLQQENVVIFEAAFAFENLFIRTDILVKKGDRIELIEVKAKSYDPADEYTFVGKRGGIEKSWKPYLFDVAFQNYVISKSHPNWGISSYLMLADKSKKAHVNGMNQMFRITRNKQNRTGIIKLIQSKDEYGETVLSRINIDQFVSKIQQNDPKFKDDLDFEESIRLFSSKYTLDQRMMPTYNLSACKKCEFKGNNQSGELKSGFHECWSEKLGCSADRLSDPNILQIWNLRGDTLLTAYNTFFLQDVTEDIFPVEDKVGQMSVSQRQWKQIEKSNANDLSPFVKYEELKQEMNTWEYPLHMIDFETTRVAIPFNAGLRPYEQVAFQFSHHKIHEDGTIEHASEYLHFEKGKFPNFEFVRALQSSLGKQGTIFKYSHHENSVLNAIHVQLSESNEPDRFELMTFIEEITNLKINNRVIRRGHRDMVDLCEVYKKYVYLPQTKGSNSIKEVLPAIIQTSSFIQEKYSKSIAEINLTSSNFDTTHRWLKLEQGEIQNPYKMLPQLFKDWTNDQLDELFSDIDDLNNGGAALTAYGFLQYTDMRNAERDELKSGLLRYCELDTLAMVMLWEGFMEMNS
jgi:hypothetical protein